jgi:hypothetical protein
MNETAKGVPVDGKGQANENTRAVDKEAYVSDKGKDKGTLKNAVSDSIIESPLTETYEKHHGENVGEIIHKSNYTHLIEEEKREKH